MDKSKNTIAMISGSGAKKIQRNIVMKVYELYKVDSGEGTRLFLSLDGVVKHLAKVWGEDCKILTMGEEYPLSVESITFGLEENFASAFWVVPEKKGESIMDIFFQIENIEYRLWMKDVEE